MNTEILASSVDSLEQLSRVSGNDRCILTVYFAGTREALHKETLQTLPEQHLSTSELSPDEKEHWRSSVAQWQETVAGVELPDAAGWVGVVSWLTEESFFVPLPVAPETSVHLDDSAFLFPAGQILDDFETYAVVYADHARAAIYQSVLGRMTEEARLRGDIKNHVRKGGWSQQRYERRRDKQVHHYCKALVDNLTDLVERHSIRRVVLTGDRVLLGEMVKRMSQVLREKVVQVLPLEGGKAPAELFAETLPLAAEEERQEEEWLLSAIARGVKQGGHAVTGLDDTLAALRERRVRWLLIGPLDGVSFWRCGSCGQSHSDLVETCAACGEAVYEQSAANELTDLAFAGGSRVEFTTSPLDEIGGVGALLRW